MREPIHEVPATDSSARQHELDEGCWCSPVGAGEFTGPDIELKRFIHRPKELVPDLEEVPPPDQPMVVEKGPQRLTFMGSPTSVLVTLDGKRLVIDAEGDVPHTVFLPLAKLRRRRRWWNA